MRGLVQLAFDFFDALESKPKQAPAPINQAPVAPEIGAIDPVPLPTLLAPTAFRHPRARREVLLGDAVVAYAFERARRRSIGFSVGPEGLSVRAPHWATLSAVDAALREKSGWILRKLQESRERQARTEQGRITWADGAALPYLGGTLRLALDPAHRFAGKGAAREGGQLAIALPHNAAPAQIRDAVQAWLMRDARRHFTERLDHFAPLLGVRWTSLRLSNANTRWGSAKADGSIRLNWRLLHYRPAIIDYVVAHELAHLRVMDHSPRFWDTVATVVPDYAQLRDHLHDEPAPLWD
ncbi:MAG: SprT family zinc-dependent metalloprotease [Acidovorax sp.]|uniref:M48 family metallopeptidase n=1 Tax=Acidovorax sp. TaxID=1872122 RepID=UPI0039E5B466